MAENWTLANPIDHTKIGDLPSEIRNVKTLTVSGMHRFFWQATAPTARYDATAFDSDDLGSIWIDSDDNVIKILTATTPTWTLISTEIIATLLAAAREIAFADATLTLKNTDAEDTDNGRQSRFIVKGVQSGDEETTLGYVEISHDGALDDQKGKCKIVLNDGDDSDSPSKIALELHADGTVEAYVDATNGSVCVKDEDNMASDSDVHLATQQSIKAFVEAEDAADHPAYSGGESHTDGSGMIIKTGTKSAGADADTTVTFATAFPTACVRVIGTWREAAAATTDYFAPKTNSASTTIFKIRNTNGSAINFDWIAIGY